MAFPLVGTRGTGWLMAHDTEVAVVGGSVAGLQAALTLGRACRRVVVFDDGRPRNAPAVHVHNYLGVPAAAPAELLAAARAMLDQYDVEVISSRVETARVADADDRTVLTTADGGTWRARAVVLATGLWDEVPDVPGISELWGRDVVACPHCHGWEVRGAPLAQLGVPGMAARGVQRAELLSRWSADVVFFTNGDELSREHSERLHAAGVDVRTEPVRRLVHSGGCLESIELDGGERISRRAVFVVTRSHQQSDLALQLGCALRTDGPSTGAVHTDELGATSVPGVWAAGTTTAPALLAVGAAGQASTVAVAVHAALLERELAGAQGETMVGQSGKGDRRSHSG